MTPSRGLTAALVAACSSTEEPVEEKPVAESTWVTDPTTVSADATEEADLEDEETEDETEEDADDANGSEQAEDGEPATRRRAPHMVAVHFQNGLFNGETEVCDLLSDEARADLVRTKVAEGAVPKGSTCKQYVRAFGESNEGLEVTVEAKVVTETEDEATVRVDMALGDEVANTRMELVPAGDTWEIVDWGRH